MVIAQSLAVFAISKAVDSDGTLVEPVVRMEPGVVSHPAPYKTSIRIRSEHHGELLKRVEQRWPWKESDADVLERVEI